MQTEQTMMLAKLNDTACGPAPVLDCVVTSRPRRGETESGDAAVIHRVGNIQWVAVVDGLGHGSSAGVAAELSRKVILSIESEEIRVLQLLARLHDALKKTRGAAATLARFDRFGAEFAAVGNVALLGLGGLSLPYSPTGGVLGGHCGPPRSRRTPLESGARLLLFSDGISRRAPFETLSDKPGAEVCETLMSDYSSEHDDATVVHITYLGSGSVD